jgi:hypothetical protein
VPTAHQPNAKARGNCFGSEVIMQSSIDVFQDVVHYLDTHEEALRIKKLIFCLCKQSWENDPEILNSVSLENLVHNLVQLKPSNEQLTFSVYKLVKTLNRPKIYASVATIIIDQIGKLYNKINSAYDTQLLDDEGETILTIKSEAIKPDSKLEQIIYRLETHQEAARIKKLLFATCQHRWENDAGAIDQYGIKKILVEIQQNNPHFATLKQSLHKIIENINKKTTYLAIAEIILNSLELLYSENNNSKISSHDTKNQELKTQIVHLAHDANHSMSEPCNSSENADFIASIVKSKELPIITELRVVEPKPVSRSIQRKEYDPFELRLEVLQYTNPLRVKILLFSLLVHPWEQSGQDWVNLRNHTLEEMLEQLIQSGTSIKEIEIKLQQAANTRVDSEANIQAAGILVQALQRIL